jgi:hypothetical protein
MTTVSSVRTEHLSRLTSRFQIGIDARGGLGQDGSGANAGLFEQILSLPSPQESYSSDDAAYQDSESTESSLSSEQPVNDATDDDSSIDENTDAAASVLVVDQQIPIAIATDETEEPTDPPNLQVVEEAVADADENPAEADGSSEESLLQSPQPVSTQDNQAESQDQANGDEVSAIDGSNEDHRPGQESDKLLPIEEALTADPSGEPALEPTEGNGEATQDTLAEPVLKSESDENSAFGKRDSSSPEQVGNSQKSENRRDPRERREKWFERET